MPTQSPKRFELRYTSINLFRGDVEELMRRARASGVKWQQLARQYIHDALFPPDPPEGKNKRTVR